jgi:hypothetical protein
MSNGQSSNGNRPLRHNYWISKPASLSRGRGIYIVNDPKQIVRSEPCVVSRYIDNPLILFGHKFDLRIYVVVTSFDPLRIYVYREGLVRFASEKYSNDVFQDEKSKFSHLTNYSINKNNENYVQNENANDDDSGFKWSLSALQSHFEAEGIDCKLMWSKLYDIIIKSIMSIDEQTKAEIRKCSINRGNCFELFGYDILLDTNLK